MQSKTQNQTAVNHTLGRVCINVLPLQDFKMLEHIPHHKMKGFAYLIPLLRLALRLL